MNTTELLIQNGQLVANTLRHLADNEIDSDYFAITSASENGTEIEHELVITDYALQAASTVEALVEALESAQWTISEQDQQLITYASVATKNARRVAELEASHAKLRERMAAIHNTIRLDGAGTSLSGLLSASKTAWDESALSGIKCEVKGE